MRSEEQTQAFLSVLINGLKQFRF